MPAPETSPTDRTAGILAAVGDACAPRARRADSGSRAALVVSVAAAALVMALVGCPRPVAEGAPGTGGVAASSLVGEATSSYLPADAALILELKDLARAQEVLRAVARTAARPGGLLEGADTELEARLGVDPLAGFALTLAGIDETRPAWIAVRPSGEVWTRLPLRDAERFLDALTLVLRREGAAPVRSVGGTLIFQRGPDDAAVGRAPLVLRRVPGGVVLAVGPDDPLAAAALASRLEEPGVSLGPDLRRPAGLAVALDPLGDADLQLWTPTRIDPDLLGEPLATLAKALSDDAGVQLVAAATLDGGELSFEARLEKAPGPGTFPRAPGACRLAEGALLVLELPAAWLPDSLDDGRPRLEGGVLIALHPHTAKVAPSLSDPFTLGTLVVTGRPTSAAAAQDLLSSFTEAAPPGRVEAIEAGGYPGRRVWPRDDVAWRVFEAVEQPELFALVSGGPGRLAAILDGDDAAGCPDTAERLRLFVDATGLRGTLRAAEAADGAREQVQPTEPSATASLSRIVRRSLVGIARLAVSARAFGQVWVVRASLRLEP